MSPGRSTTAEYLVMLRALCTTPKPWTPKERTPSSMCRVSTWPETTSTGTPSAYASTSPASALTAPGPLVTSATPSSPVSLAAPVAISAAAVSCRAQMVTRPGCWLKAWSRWMEPVPERL